MKNAVDRALATLQSNEIVPRVWRGDHTVWKPEPREVSDRLGWLTVDQMMTRHVAELREFAASAVSDGITHVVLLGMGGSSLGPEVMGKVLHRPGQSPRFTVLDSTVPSAVLSVRETIDPGKTLFLVSSKSGGTVETMCLYAYFRAEVESVVGGRSAGRNFVAITDPGTSLERLASDAGFRKAFLNPPDIGGRYSVLSYFGLVPAALIGIDVRDFLGAASTMRDACSPAHPPEDNPGAYLGAAIGALALAGRDKLTIITSPSLTSLGLWIEQLIAESTGKEGKGIVPVVGEPIGRPEVYGGDRQFVYIRLESDADAELDEAVDALEGAGHPALRLTLGDRYDLAGEFYRWEFAVAIAASLLKVNPFDQPDVQSAKDQTDLVLGEFERTGSLPMAPETLAPTALFASARPGDYLAITAFVGQTAETDDALGGLRQSVMESRRIATTLGYGPRFLHSTGQLHKGGPPSNLVLQLLAEHQQDVAVPGRAFSFGTLASAQAHGDLLALVARGTNVARVDLGASVLGALARLVEAAR
jgi:glucose-6-phosphate isomerase/transaldolase/glucose-6-phosphate isomerase